MERPGDSHWFKQPSRHHAPGRPPTGIVVAACNAGKQMKDFSFLQLRRRIENPSRSTTKKMSRTPTICAVSLLVMALSVASAGAFACQIECAVAPTAPPAGHTASCGGHTEAQRHGPVHLPGNDKGGHQHSGHSHTRIIAAAQGSAQQTALHQTGVLPQITGGVIAPASENHAQGIGIASAKSPGRLFTPPVLRI
jgi:hypothetical protein